MSQVVQAASSTGAQPSRAAGAGTVARVLVVDSDPLQVLYVATCGEALFAQDIPHSADDDVLEKPFSEDELMDAVSALLYWHRPPRSRR